MAKAAQKNHKIALFTAGGWHHAFRQRRVI